MLEAKTKSKMGQKVKNRSMETPRSVSRIRKLNYANWNKNIKCAKNEGKNLVTQIASVHCEKFFGKAF